MFSVISAQIPVNIPTPLLTNDIVHVDAATEALQNDKVYVNLTGPAATAIPPGTVVLPVAIHIVHKGDGSGNISDSQVNDALLQINNAFRGAFSGVNTEIQFCLAKQDPDGHINTGITRDTSDLSDVTMETTDAALKQLVIWDPYRYVNIWIVNSITSTSSGPAITAYSTMPSSHGTSTDGIVIESAVFGVSDELSRIAVHNIGHYLGLYHTFENRCKNDNCLLDGDRVGDTPPDATTQYVSCFESINSCNTDDDDLSVNNPFRPVANGGIGDQPDLSNNYMDQNYLSCINSFTPGQKNRARSMLYLSRSSLLASGTCNPGCPETIKAAFSCLSSAYVNNPHPFTNRSTPDSGLTYEWYDDDVLFSTAKSPTYTFTTLGAHVVKLIVHGSTPACTDEHRMEITVRCPSEADFLADALSVTPNSMIHFENKTPGSFSSEWYVNDTLIDTSLHFNYTFRRSGFYNVSLKVTSGICTSRRDAVVEVNNCTQIGKRANNWFFGENAGIKFMYGMPVFNRINTTYTENGCATISNKLGDFLFAAIPDERKAANYQTVIYDKNFNAMPNGSDIAGSTAASQILIVPHPGNADIYYVFSTFADAAGGLYVSTVDMSRNGGLGDVTSKNVMLLNSSTEKIAATMHSNGIDVWVTCHQWNSACFYTYPVTAGGLQTTPVISTTGTILTGDVSGASGILKFSPNGKYLAMSSKYLTNAFVEVYDFDNTSGKISYFLKINDLPNVYGLEFSPDQSKLYTAQTNYYGPVCQFDLSLNNARDVILSKCVLYTTAFEQMQLAPDQRIYLSKYASTYMATIQAPDKAGNACNFQRWSHLLPDSSEMRSGLPGFVSNYVVPVKMKITGPTVAVPNAQRIIYRLSPDPGKNYNVQWVVYGQGLIAAQSFGTAMIHFKSAGTAKIVCTVYYPCGKVSDTLLVNVNMPSINLGPDQQLCSGSSILLDPGSRFLSYLWQDSSTAPTYRVTRAGTYHVTAVVPSNGTSTAIKVSDTIVITQSPEFNLGPDQTICAGSTVILDPGSAFTNYRWQDGSTNQTFNVFQTVPEAGVTHHYSVTATDQCGLPVSDDINITFTLPYAYAGSDVTTCIYDPVVLRGTGSGTPRWYNSSGVQIGTSHEITVNPTTSTFYVFTVDIDGCIGRDTVNVSISPDCAGCTVDAGPDGLLCKGMYIMLTATTNGHCTRNNCSTVTPPSDCTSGCTGTLTGSGYVDINSGTVLCIPEGSTFTGGVNINGGKLVVCGSANLGSFNLNSGEIVVTGTLYVPNLNISGIFRNYGNTTIEYFCSVNSPGEFYNYGSFTVNGSFSTGSITKNYSVMTIAFNLNQNGNSVFTNECTINIADNLNIGSEFINRGIINVAQIANLNGGSRYVGDDGSLLDVRHIYCSGQINGGTVGRSSIHIREKSVFYGSARAEGLIDICDASGIDTLWGIFDSSVTTDCRSEADGSGGVATFIWTDSFGTMVGTGKRLTVAPESTSTYTVTVTDVNGTNKSDSATITVNNCP